MKKKVSRETKRVGRPKLDVKEKVEKYNFEFAKIKKLAECGLIDNDFCKILGIAKRTWENWKKADSEFNALLKSGKEIADRNVEQSLYKRAIGYQYQEITREPKIIVENGVTRTEMQISKQVIKEVAPDVGAIAFWLKNRKSDIWKERTNIDLGSSNPESLTQMLQVAGKILRNEV